MSSILTDNTATVAAANSDSIQSRIAIQGESVSTLADSGIGALVDANVAGTWARLQALQRQQQSGLQALSLANQAPQNILALFR